MIVHFGRIKRKEFFELPPVKKFIEKVFVNEEGQGKFQQVALRDYQNARQKEC